MEDLRSDLSMADMLAITDAYEELEAKGHFDGVKQLAQMNVMTIHMRKKATKRNPCRIVVVPNFQFAHFRILKHRGIERTPLAARLMTEDEIKFHNEQYRFCYYGFWTWDLLIEHEAQMFNTPDWMQILNTLKSDNPFEVQHNYKKKGKHKGQYELKFFNI
jgi:hypothetical protein